MNEAKEWRERWVEVGVGVGGGQGDVKHVVPKDGSDSTTRFLKILRHQNDPLRRARMYREVAAYRTLDEPGIPTLIDTNASRFSDREFKLYLVSAFVPGTTLEGLISRDGAQSFADAMGMTIRLLQVVEHCHQAEVVHRDIKHENIVLRDGCILDPVLVDFGLSFNAIAETSSSTLLAEEVGNRFLRLPELAPGSVEKRDPRSDVTFCAGVLLYALTSEVPAVLTDSAGNLPHQRTAAAISLARFGDTRPARQLRTVFDKAFQHDLTRRWQSAVELRQRLEAILSSPDADDASEISRLRAEIHENREADHVRHGALLAERLGGGLQRIVDSMSAFQEAEGLGDLERIGASREIKAEEGFAEDSRGFGRRGAQTRSLIRFRVEVVGSDLVFTATYDGQRSDLYRTPIAAPHYDTTFAVRLERLLLLQVRDCLGQRR